MVDETLYEQYTQALDANSELLERAISNLEKELAGLTDDALEQALAARYASLVREYGSIAAAVACDFYTQQRQLAQVEQQHGAYTAIQAQTAKDWSLYSDVGRALTKKEIGKLLQELNASATRRAYEQADNTLLHNASKDPAHPKWAFVPRLGACAWCVFLGSQGFVYHSQSTVSASRHKHCRCTSVVDFDTKNPSLKGYNQAAMQDAYKKCRDTVIDDIDSKWAAMSDKDKENYAKTHNIRKGHKVYDVYQRNQIIQEMKTRDREWLRTGKATNTDYSINAKSNYGKLVKPNNFEKENITNKGNEWRDLWVHHVLEQNGIKAIAQGSRDLDLMINGQWWEVKSPETPSNQGEKANTLSFVDSNIKKASRQFKKRGYKNTRVIFNSKYRTDLSDEYILEEVKRQKIKRSVSEIIFINKNGDLIRLTN